MNFNTGDTVKIGQGKARYVVLEVLGSGIPVIENVESGRVQSVNPNRLNLVATAAQTEAMTEYAKADVKLTAETQSELRKLNDVDKALRFAFGHTVSTPKPEPLPVDENDHRTSFYGKTILGALQSFATVFSGKADTPKNRARRLARNRAAKQARKAQRRNR